MDPKRVYIKPNFTFADGIVPVKKQPEEEYYLFAGRVEALKGIDIAVKAFENCRIRFFMLQEQDR